MCSPDLRQPVLCRRNPTQIFSHMLLPDIAHWYLPAVAVGDCDPEDALAQEDSFGMVPKSAMSKVWEDGFGLIEPVVDWQVILDFAAKLSSAALCVLQRVGHDYTS